MLNQNQLLAIQKSYSFFFLSSFKCPRWISDKWKKWKEKKKIFNIVREQYSVSKKISYGN